LFKISQNNIIILTQEFVFIKENHLSFFIFRK